MSKVVEVSVDGSRYAAHGWTLDDGTLHLRQDGTIVASFAPGAWRHVLLVEQPVPDAVPAMGEQVFTCRGKC